MIHPAEYVCPLCGLMLDSLTAFHRHVEKQHEPKKPQITPLQELFILGLLASCGLIPGIEGMRLPK